jgi:molybdenum-dependent DNA-binding transcriptional regulator ModE
MERRGRKPLATKHVERLDGSQQAKLRLTTILETMRGELTIPEACRRLGMCESRFHALRHRWLQESLELLEPRRAGRPSKQPQTSPREEELVEDNARLEKDLQVARAQREVAEVMAVTGSAGATKKKRPAPVHRRRHNQRRPR